MILPNLASNVEQSIQPVAACMNSIGSFSKPHNHPQSCLLGIDRLWKMKLVNARLLKCIMIWLGLRQFFAFIGMQQVSF
jgi:hypothetical protein